MLLKHSFYLVDCLRALLLKHLVGDGTRQHVTGDVPCRSGKGQYGKRDKYEGRECLICSIGSLYCLDVICHGHSTRSTTTRKGSGPAINFSKEGRGMVTRIIVVLLVSLVHSSLGQAQQPKKVARIGYLASGSPAASVVPNRDTEAFYQGLRELGYI